jgi:hypothetical protein
MDDCNAFAINTPPDVDYLDVNGDTKVTNVLTSSTPSKFIRISLDGNMCCFCEWFYLSKAVVKAPYVS